MQSRVAEHLRQMQIRHIQSLSPGERAVLSLRLGQRDLEFYLAVHGVDRLTAIQQIRLERQNGRRYSRCQGERAK